MLTLGTLAHVSPQTFAGQDEWMEELLGDEYYVELFAEIADSEPITEAIDEVSHALSHTRLAPARKCENGSCAHWNGSTGATRELVGRNRR